MTSSTSLLLLIPRRCYFGWYLSFSLTATLDSESDIEWRIRRNTANCCQHSPPILLPTPPCCLLPVSCSYSGVCTECLCLPPSSMLARYFHIQSAQSKCTSSSNHNSYPLLRLILLFFFFSSSVSPSHPLDYPTALTRTPQHPVFHPLPFSSFRFLSWLQGPPVCQHTPKWSLIERNIRPNETVLLKGPFCFWVWVGQEPAYLSILVALVVKGSVERGRASEAARAVESVLTPLNFWTSEVVHFVINYQNEDDMVMTVIHYPDNYHE